MVPCNSKAMQRTINKKGTLPHGEGRCPSSKELYASALISILPTVSRFQRANDSLLLINHSSSNPSLRCRNIGTGGLEPPTSTVSR
jgi:hypothetical protein